MAYQIPEIEIDKAIGVLSIETDKAWEDPKAMQKKIMNLVNDQTRESQVVLRVEQHEDTPGESEELLQADDGGPVFEVSDKGESLPWEDTEEIVRPRTPIPRTESQEKGETLETRSGKDIFEMTPSNAARQDPPVPKEEAPLTPTPTAGTFTAHVSTAFTKGLKTMAQVKEETEEDRGGKERRPAKGGKGLGNLPHRPDLVPEIYPAALGGEGSSVPGIPDYPTPAGSEHDAMSGIGVLSSQVEEGVSIHGELTTIRQVIDSGFQSVATVLATVESRLQALERKTSPKITPRKSLTAGDFKQLPLARGTEREIKKEPPLFTITRDIKDLVEKNPFSPVRVVQRARLGKILGQEALEKIPQSVLLSREQWTEAYLSLI